MTTDPYDRFSGARSTYYGKKPCRAASTANLTLSSTQTIDGEVFTSDDEDNGLSLRVLVMNQTDASENGIYEVSSGDWSRTVDFDGNTDFTRGTQVFVTDGTAYGGGLFWVSSTDPQDIGTNDISFTQLV